MIFVDARKQKNEQFVTAEQLQNEKKLLEGDLQTMQISFQNLHQRYDDLKSLYDQQKMVNTMCRIYYFVAREYSETEFGGLAK